MKTKKLHVIAFLIGAFAFINNLNATTYYWCGTGNINDRNQWWTISNCTGLHPSAGFPGAHTYNIKTAGTYSINGTWTISNGSIVNVGFGGAAVTLITNGNAIKSGTGSATLNVLGSAILTVTTSNFFASSNKLVLGTCSAGSLVDYSLAGATVGGGTYDNLTISADATLGGNVVSVNNVFTNPSVLTFGGGFLGIFGTTAGGGTLKGDASAAIDFEGVGTETLMMDQTTVGVTNVMGSVQVNGGGVLNLGNALEIAPGGDITPVNGTIDVSAGSVLLQANQTSAGSTGSIGTIGGTFIGNITSQIFHNPSGNMTDWTLLGSPGIVGMDFTSWNASFPITCLNCPDGYYPGGTAFGSVTSYVEASDTYPEITNITDPMTIGQGWWVYMGNSAPGTSTTGEIINVTGAPNLVSPFTYGVTAGGAGGGYNLVANPYPSPLSWTSVQSNNANIGTSFYAWSPNTGAHSSFNAATGLGSPLSGSYALSDVIPTGMGFYVVASAGPSISFSETDKLQGTQVLLRHSKSRRANNNVQKTLFPAFSLQANGSGMSSESVVGFVPTSTTGFDVVEDTKKFGSTPGQLSISSVVAGIDLAINCLPDLTVNNSIPIKMLTGTTGTYTINAANLQRMPIGPCLVLHDNYTLSNYDLRQGPFTLTLNDTETVARFVLNITVNPLSITTSATQASCPVGGDAILTAVGTNAGPWNYTWKNSTGVVVKTTTNKATADSLTGLSAGVYNVEVNTVGTCDNASQSYTLALPSTVTSAYSVSSNTVFVNSNLTFTDNSTNANSYWWDFGDGNTSNLQSPVYAYNTTGTFDVTFYAINSVCGDTAISTKTIDVFATTGIVAAVNSEMLFSKDQNGTFIKFNYGAQTRVNISVYNALGQALSVNTNQSVTSDKIYLNLDNAKDQMIFVSIANLDKNTQITKKLYNN